MKNTNNLQMKELDRVESGHSLRMARNPEASPRIIRREMESRFNSNAPIPIQISLEELKSFETVDNQFLNVGVKFTNTMAIEPSNPAFGAPKGVKVLMAAPKNGLIEISFTNPVKWVSARVTSSRRTILSAYDRLETQIARAEMSAPNLAGANSSIQPNAPLKVQADAISKATFYAFEGQLVIVDLSFGF
ncbi:MAG: hypothetical protein SXA11_19950 [Cyanobacteriota bacterium]|nr:hypothetical protein [Cyanobacteriota bacterium]